MESLTNRSKNVHKTFHDYMSPYRIPRQLRCYRMRSYLFFAIILPLPFFLSRIDRLERAERAIKLSANATHFNSPVWNSKEFLKESRIGRFTRRIIFGGRNVRASSLQLRSGTG